MRRKDDLDFWLSMNRDFGVPWGPWGFSSGMGVEDVGRREAIALGIIKPGDVIAPVEREFNDRLSASVRDLDPRILAELQRLTGGTIAGGRLAVRERVADVAAGFGRLAGEMTPVEVPPRNFPVSSRLRGVKDHPLATALENTLTVVDSVQDDGLLGILELRATRNTRNVGSYEYSERTGQPLRMEVSEHSPWPEITLLHEIGHWFDQQVFGGRDGFGSASGRWENMAHLMDKGETAHELRRMIRSERSIEGARRELYPGAIEHLKTLVKPEEIFARGWAEWICNESQHPRLLELLEYANSKTIGGYGLRGSDREKFREIMLNELEWKNWK